MNAHQRAKAVLTRALELEPGHVRARRLLIMLAARTNDTALLTRIASPAALRDSVGDISDFLRWRVALVRGDSTALRRIRAHMSEINDQSLRAMAMSSIHDAVGLEDGERAAKITLRRADRDGSWFDALMEQHSFALNEGQPSRALEITSELETHLPGTRAHLRLRVSTRCTPRATPSPRRERLIRWRPSRTRRSPATRRCASCSSRTSACSSSGG